MLRISVGFDHFCNHFSTKVVEINKVNAWARPISSKKTIYEKPIAHFIVVIFYIANDYNAFSL